MQTPSRKTILSGLSTVVTDPDERAELVARADRRADRVFGGRFDREVRILIADYFGCELSPASNGRIGITVQPYFQGQSGIETRPARARMALVAVGFDGTIFLV